MEDAPCVVLSLVFDFHANQRVIVPLIAERDAALQLNSNACAAAVLMSSTAAAAKEIHIRRDVTTSSPSSSASALTAALSDFADVGVALTH